MKNKITTLQWLLSAGLLAALATSCATPALWKQTAAREWKPNPPDQIILITDTNQQSDVVVLFRQFATLGSTGNSRTVGWRVSRPAGELALTAEALRQLTNSVCECQPVSMFFETPEPRDLSSLSLGYTVWSSMDQQLSVHIPGLPPGPYTLPASLQERQTALRVCALPVAVAFDAALVGAALFVAGASGYHGP